MMRYRILPILLLVMVSNTFFSCSKSNQEETLLPELERAEAIMYQHPDSALQILETMPVPDSSDKLQHATWCLLITQARYKNYLVQSDSLAHIAKDYFIKESNSQRRALSLYLLGALNRESKNIEDALAYYLEATKEIVKTDDYQLGHLIYVGIGNIYVFRDLYDYAQEAFKKSHEFAVLSGSESYLAGSLWSLGRSYSSFENWEKAIELYTEALEHYKKLKDQRSLCNLLTELSGIYLKTKDYDLTLKYGHKALDIQKKYGFDESISSGSVGIAYYFTGNLDSAYHFLDKATSSGSIYTRRNAYQFLYNISKERKDYVNALEYSSKRILYVDSIRNLDRIATLTEMQAKYNQEKIINEKNQLKIERDKVARNGLITLLVLLCFGVIMIYFYQRKIRLKEKTIQKKESQIREYLLKIHENDVLIQHNLNRIKELKMEVEVHEGKQKELEQQGDTIQLIQTQNKLLLSENNRLRNSISEHASSLQKSSKDLEALKILSEANMFLREREKFLCNELLKKTKILDDLKKSPKYLDIIQWACVIETIDWLFYQYTQRLKKNIPSLTEGDLQLCCLIKINLSISEIALILGISPTSVSKRKQRLKERVINDIGKPFDENQTIDLWLWGY